MAEVVNPRGLPDPAVLIPGLKPRVRDFAPSDDGDPSEAGAFIEFVRELRHRRQPVGTDRK
jgi:hypothetical protein